MYITLHAAAVLISSLLALVCGIKTWEHYQETKNELVRDLAFVFYSITIAMLFLLPPALFADPGLLPPFMALALFFLFLGMAFFSKIIISTFPKLANQKDKAFKGLVFIAALMALLTYLSGPTIKFDYYNIAVVYYFPTILKFHIIVLIILLTSFLSSGFFFRQGFSSSVFATKIRSILFGLALIFMGSGILLVVIGEKFVYNFLIVLANLSFYLSVSLREKPKTKFYGKI